MLTPKKELVLTLFLLGIDAAYGVGVDTDADVDDANVDDVNDDDALAMFLMMMVFRIGVRTVRTRPALFDKCLRYFISKE